MKKISSFFLDVLVFAGSILFIFAFVLALIVAERQHTFIIDLMPIFTLAFGIMLLIFTFTLSHKAYQLFSGLFLIIGSIFVFLLVRGYLPFTIYQWWPFLGVVVGIILFITGRYKYKSIKVGYALPSLAIFLLGGWLMLFSFKVIKVPFSEVALIGGPLFMIFVLIFLFAFFLLQQKNNNFVVEDDGPNSFEDDEQ